jgi:DNA-binding XRE family transcriptional regulator
MDIKFSLLVIIGIILSLYVAKVNRYISIIGIYQDFAEAKMKIYHYNARCNASGEKIKALRKAADLSQEQLAAQLQVAGLSISQKQISRIETGARVVADYELLHLARVLKTSADELLSEK